MISSACSEGCDCSVEVPATLGGPMSPELPSGACSASSLTPLTVIVGISAKEISYSIYYLVY